MRRLPRVKVFGGLLVLGLVACTTQLTTVPAGSTLPESAFGYYLPREVYSIEVTYQLVACPDPAIGVLTGTNPPLVKQTATITPIDIADLDEHYYITFKSMNSVWKNTAFQATLYPNQTLKSVGAEIASQVPQVASNLISGGFAIAKVVAGAQAIGAPTCKKDVAAALSGKQQSQDASPNATPAARGKGTVHAKKSVDQPASATVSTSQSTFTIQVVGILDPTNASDLKLVIQPRADDLAKWFDGAVTSDLLQKLISTTVVMGRFPSIPTPAKPSESPIQGLVYRDPVPATVQVCAGIEPSTKCDLSASPKGSFPEQVIATQTVSVPQLGPYVLMSLVNSGFDNNNMAITFAPNGVPCSMVYASQSQMYQISSILSAVGSAGGSSSGSSKGGSSGSGKAAGTSGTGGATGSGGSGGGGSGGGGSGAGGGGSQATESTATAPTATCSS